MIAEDPRVPEPYSTVLIFSFFFISSRKFEILSPEMFCFAQLLGTLRDDNTPMSMVSFYHNLVRIFG